ncbi:MAG: OmpA family protein [Myxococcales bacterium]|nr:OmpA family protein [Myxococcales bacterium]
MSRSAFVVVLAAGLGATPGMAWAEPDDDLSLDDEEDDPLADDGDEEDEEDPFADDEDSGASASGSASVSLGGGAKADGKAKRGKRGKQAKKDKGSGSKGSGSGKCTASFFECYRPGNHMLDAGLYLGGFWRADNHGLFNRGFDTQPSTSRGAFDIGFRLEYMPIPWVGLGFETSGMPTSSASEGGARAGFYTVRGHVIGSLPYRLTPTLAIGGGLLGLRSRSSDILNGSDQAFHWGPGLKFFVNDWIAVRMDGRHIVTGPGTDSGRSHHGELLFGAEVTIRLTKWVGKKWRAQRTDSDGDTIADYYDKCPQEFGEDEDGCPLNRDSDKDGIPDRRDSCPNEWGDGADGCPIPDQDGDGILDTKDSCENEPENFNGIEDEDGCPDELPDEVKSFEGVIKGIYFDTGKATIRKNSRRMLDSAVKLLQKYPQLRIEISGHTDSKGSHDDNVKLSQDRADSVKQYMVDAGIEEGRMTTRGAGPDEPIADNGNKRGRSLNRRIEFKVIQ